MKTIACLGDSLTGPSVGKRYLDSYVKWTDLLALSIRVAEPGRACSVVNYGKAGDTSSGLCERAEAHLEESHPDVAVIWIGANDFANGADPEKTARELRTNLEALIAMARSQTKHVLLLCYPKARALHSTEAWRHHDLARPVILKAGEDLGVDVLDLEPAFAEAEKHLREVELVNDVDGVHLNPGGELVVAQAVYERLFKLR